ncbi:hypothetical protein [Paenibacillus sp. 1P07SE]|uniref:hypothetical protein n=1 Tax=Paenibacillus sp. 1P07SE TaxID=3132209 RepID=UPI0039A43B98
MTAIFIWVISCYLAAMLAVHLHGRFRSKRALTIEHYILIGNHEEQGLEWQIRRIRWRSFWSGIPARMTVIDEDDASHSSLIASKLLRQDDQIVCVAATGEWRVLRCETAGSLGEGRGPAAESNGDSPEQAGREAPPGDWGRLQEGPLLWGGRQADAESYLEVLHSHGVAQPEERTVLIDLRRG